MPFTIDDSPLEYPPISPVCSFCANRQGFGRGRCAAFPNRIPMEIWLGYNDHTAPYPGDGGIQFLALPPVDESTLSASERYALKLITEGDDNGSGSGSTEA